MRKRFPVFSGPAVEALEHIIQNESCMPRQYIVGMFQVALTPPRIDTTDLEIRIFAAWQIPCSIVYEIAGTCRIDYAWKEVSVRYVPEHGHGILHFESFIEKPRICLDEWLDTLCNTTPVHRTPPPTEQRSKRRRPPKQNTKESHILLLP